MPDIGKLSNWFKRLSGTYKYLFIVIAAGLVILLLPSDKQAGEEVAREAVEEAFDLAAFEKRIEDILESGEGVGRVDVVLTMKSGMEYVYAEESKTNLREQKENGDTQDLNRDSDVRPSILSDGSGGEEPVVVKKLYPEFLGAAVVCDGAENPKVQLYITDAISSLTGIASDRITVIKMKN